MNWRNRSKQLRWLALLVCLSALAQITSVHAGAVLSELTGVPTGCLHSFEQFAYVGPRDPKEPLQLPGEPWQPDTKLAELTAGYQLGGIELARPRGDTTEMWIDAIDPQNERFWIVYDSKAERLTVVSAAVSDREFNIHSVYADANGTVWGTVTPADYRAYSGTYPVLARFDEDQQRFVLVENMLEVTYTIGEPIQYQFDGQDVIWTLVSYDAVYAFNTVSRNIERVVDLTGLRVLVLTIAPDKSLMYLTVRSSGSDADADGVQYQYPLYQLDYESRQPRSIDYPEEWPFPWGILFDADGRLWWGVIGYRDVRGTWHLTHPDLQQYNEPSTFLTGIWWPTLVYASSDGRLWYTNWADGGHWYWGSAWFDPDSGSGCMFTNYYSRVREDADGVLWLVAGGEVFTARLEDLYNSSAE